MSSSLPLNLALALIPKLKPAERLLLSDLVPDLKSLYRMNTRDLRAATGRSLPLEEVELKQLPRELERVLHFVERSGVRVIEYWDLAYPALLREIHDPPFLLYLKGRMPDAFLPPVAVVGTRKAAPDELSAAFTFSAELALSGLPLVSGLAMGIDRAAHEAALRCGGYTMAVLGSGPDIVYPGAHRGLAERILSSGGGLLSDYPPGTPPLRHHFPARNRIITGLSRAVMVITAPARSGALISADYALEQGRDLFVHPVGLDREGTGALHRQGAAPIRRASELLHHWSFATGRRGRCEILGRDFCRPKELIRGELQGKSCFYHGVWYAIHREEKEEICGEPGLQENPFRTSIRRKSA